MQIVQEKNNEATFSFNIKEGFAYEALVDIECQSYQFSVGEIYARQTQIIGRRNNTQNGVNKFIFYAEQTGLVTVDFVPSKSTINAKVSSIEIRDLGEALKEPSNLGCLNVVAAVASIPSRVLSLKDTVNSILPQVDRLFVYLNGYVDVPSFLKDERIEVILDFEGRNAAAAKLYWLSKVKAYYFSIDDDIIYPSDYCEKTIDNYKNNAVGAVVSYHGKNLKPLAGHQRLDRKEMFLFEKELKINTRAHVLGTGVMMVDTRKINLPLFEVASHHPRAIDLAVSTFLREKGIARYVLKKDSEWLKQNEKVGHGLNEFKQLVKGYSRESCQQVVSGRPWVESRILFIIYRIFMIPCNPVLESIDRNRKLKKLIRDPARFFMDSKNPLINKLIKFKL